MTASSDEKLHVPLDRRHFADLADALGDTPETVIAVHQLRRGLCRAFLAGEPQRPAAAIVQGDRCPEEPSGFGEDPELLWRLLQAVKGWYCPEVSASCAAGLGEIMERRTGRAVQHYGDVHHTLTGPVADVTHPAVRELALADLPFVEAAPCELRPRCFATLAAGLTEGAAAGAIVGRRIVAICHTAARSDRHADLGVFTAEVFRGRGMATAAAALVARRIRQAGQIPVWSAGETNTASLRVAQKVGFVEICRRIYLIPAKD